VKDLGEQGFVFDVYGDWKETLGGWSKQLWTDVQPESMARGTEEFIQRLKKMDSKYKELEPYNGVNETVRNFYDSLPLFKDVKHEALRDRHWKMLMDVTGKTFDFGSFTLQNLVEMRLYEFKEEILNIVGGAARELSIEKSMPGSRRRGERGAWLSKSMTATVWTAGLYCWTPVGSKRSLMTTS
jgi:dynein heavy chain, axonemal